MAENEIMTLDEYVTLRQRYIKNIEKARQAVFTDDPDWPALVKEALDDASFKVIILNHWLKGALASWIDNHQSDALDALQALWAKDDTPISDRIRAFVPRVKPEPKYTKAGFTGTGTKLRGTAALLMALDPLQCPPFKPTAFEDAYTRTGYPTPPKGADEADTYKHALEFLDKLVERANAQGSAKPSSRLEAQADVWLYRF